MCDNTYNLVDNLGNIRTSKHLLGHIQTVFSDIKSSEVVTYPWKVTASITKKVLVIDASTTQNDWREFDTYCEQLL